MPRIIDPTADFEASASEIYLPVMDGLSYWGVLNTDEASIKRNLSPGGAGSALVGSPIIDSRFVRVKGGANYLQSGVAETDSMTLVAVMKTSDDPSIGTAHQALFLSSYDGLKGASLWMVNPTTGSGQQGRIRMSARATATVNATLGNADLSQWALYIGTVTPSLIGIYDMTRDLQVEVAVSGARDKSAQSFRIGSSYSSVFQGEVDLAVAGIYNRALSLAERTALRSYLKDTYLPTRGITI